MESLTIQMILRESLRLLKNSLTFTPLIRQKYNDQFARQGAKIGDTVGIPLHGRYLTGDGESVTPQELRETKVQVKVDRRKHLALQFTNFDLTLNINDFSDRHLKDPVAKLANQIDYDGLQLYKRIYNYVGVPGTNPNAVQTYLDAGTLMTNMAAPMNGRNNVLSSQMHGAIANTLHTLFNPQVKISEVFRTGMIAAQTLGADWYMDQNTARHTVGTLTGSTPLVNGAGQAGTDHQAGSIITDGWAPSTLVLRRGDVIELAGVSSVNPQNYQPNPGLAHFVVTADVTSTAGGAATIPISPGIVTSGGAYQTVSAAPADNAVITVFGKAAANFADITGKICDQGLMFHPEAFTCVMVDLEKGDAILQERASDPDLGISMLYSRQTNIMDLKTVARLDVLYGWAVLQPELACRIIGN